MPRTWSPVWKFFEKKPEDSTKANCRICLAEFSIPGGTTSSLSTHLMKKHIEEFKMFEEIKKEKPASSSEVNVTIAEEKFDSIIKPKDENIKLSWPNHSDNLKEMLKIMKTKYSDVTLISEDKEQYKAHKVVLSACSPFFDSIISGIVHNNPVIYLRGVKAEDLDPILQFMYSGEAVVSQSRINDFLQTANILEIKDIVVNIAENEVIIEQDKTDMIIDENSVDGIADVDPISFECEVNINSNSEESNENKFQTFSSRIKNSVIDMKNVKLYSCEHCEYEAKLKTNLIRHIQSVHEGIKYQCSDCGKKFSSKAYLNAHTNAIHAI